MNRRRTEVWLAAVLLAAVCLLVCALEYRGAPAAAQEITAAAEQTAQPGTGEAEIAALRAPAGYTPERMVIFSRHNIRAPLVSGDSVIGKMTPHAWTDFTAAAGELTLIGGTQETAMGQYFRKYAAASGLMEENAIPAEGQVRVYSNSYQRTIATARYFTAGFLPLGNVAVEYHMGVGEMDPVFFPCLNYMSEAYREQVQRSWDALAGGEGIPGVLAGISDDIAVLYDVLDFADSDYAKENGITAIATDDTAITLALGEEPQMSGGFKTINSAADALVMQYYDAASPEGTAFGKSLTAEQWQAVGRINTTYQGLLFGLPEIAVNVAHPLLIELKGELTAEGRLFSLLCGHDSNVETLMVALGVEEFAIGDNIHSLTPIGCKLVWERYRDEAGEDYLRMSLVYQASEKLRENRLVTMDAPPSWQELTLTGLEKNADGLYRLDDVLARFDEAIAAFDALPADEAPALPLAG